MLGARLANEEQCFELDPRPVGGIGVERRQCFEIGRRARQQVVDIGTAGSDRGAHDIFGEPHEMPVDEDERLVLLPFGNQGVELRLDRDHPGAATKQRRLVERELIDERSEEQTSELQSLLRSSYAVFCLKKKTT